MTHPLNEGGHIWKRYISFIAWRVMVLCGVGLAQTTIMYDELERTGKATKLLFYSVSCLRYLTL